MPRDNDRHSPHRQTPPAPPCPSNKQPRRKYASVVLLCGLPGSGKSTLASSLLLQSSLLQSKSSSASHNAGSGAEEGPEEADDVDDGEDQQQQDQQQDQQHQWTPPPYYDETVLIDYDVLANEIAAAAAGAATADDGKRSPPPPPPREGDGFRADDCDGHPPGDRGIGAPSTSSPYDGTDLKAWRTSREAALSRLHRVLADHFADDDDDDDGRAQTPATAAEHAGTGSDAGEGVRSSSSSSPSGSGSSKSLLVILDDNFHLRSMRRDVYRVCRGLVTGWAEAEAESAEGSADGGGGDGRGEEEEGKNDDGGNKRDAAGAGNAGSGDATTPYPTTTAATTTTTTRKITTNNIIGFSVIYVATPLRLCLERNATRKHGSKERIPESIVRKMAESIEPPPIDGSADFAQGDGDGSSTRLDYSKRFERCSVVVDGGVGNGGDDSSSSSSSSSSSAIIKKQNFDRVRSCIARALRNHPINPSIKAEVKFDEEALKKEREQTMKNRVHRADMVLRTCVGGVGRKFKNVGRAANEARKVVLEMVRNDDIATGTAGGGNGGYETDDKFAFEMALANEFKRLLLLSSSSTSSSKTALSEESLSSVIDEAIGGCCKG